MKKISLIVFVVLCFLLVTGCKKMETKSDKISVVCTNFAVFDWVNNIVDEDDFQVTLLWGSGDVHSFQPAAKDMAELSTCDLFIYVGRESDIWAEKFVADNGINNLKLSELLKADLLWGDEDHHNHEHNDVESFDEHIWLSLRSAQKAVDGIYGKLTELVSETNSKHILEYENNKNHFKSLLEKLDVEYKRAVEDSEDKTIVVADRFPFLYLTSDYGINYVAAFSGCSTDQDAGFDVIAKLTQTVDDMDKRAVVVLEKSDSSVAEVVKDNVSSGDVEIVVMNSCQTIDQEEIEAGMGYIEIMEENLEALKKALE